MYTAVDYYSLGNPYPRTRLRERYPRRPYRKLPPRLFAPIQLPIPGCCHVSDAIVTSVSLSDAIVTQCSVSDAAVWQCSSSDEAC